MATKFYLLNEAAPYTPPSWRGSWDVDGTTDRHFDPHKFGAGSAVATRAETSATNPFKLGGLRLVSRRLLNGQTIDGTVNMVVGVQESNAAANFFTRLHIYIVDTSDGSVVGTLLNGYTESSGGGATEWPTTNTGRALQSAQTLTSVAVPASGDYRLVAELGASCENADTTSRSLTIRLGARNFSTGNAFGDLTAGSTSTTTLAGYFEFSDDISLAADVIANLTPETATDIGSLPYTATQDMRDGGHTYTPWYKFTPTTEVGMGWFGYGDASIYKPSITVFKGSSPSALSTTNVDTSTGNLGVQVAFITPGQTYYVRHFRNSVTANPATITLDVVAAPDGDAPRGGLLVMDDTLHVAMVVSATTGEVVKMIPGFAPGEGGDVLPSGIIAAEDVNNVDVKIYAADFTEIATVPINASTVAGSIRANRATNKFWIGSNPGTDAEVSRVAPDGTIEQTYTLTGITDLHAVAASRDETILYFSRASGGIIGRWDLVSEVALSNLVADATIESIFDVIVLDDDTILASFVTTGPPTDIVEVRQYNASGTLLNTYDMGASSELLQTIPRIQRPASGSSSFWFFGHPNGANEGLSRFRNIAIAGGATSTTLDVVEYEGGIYNRPETATPEARFGVSFSCPLIVLPGGSSPVLDDSDPCCEDLSTFMRHVGECSSGPTGEAGVSGSMEAPEAGTWSNTLNATSGSGGASGSSWSLPDPDISENWG